ncbi:hypothetical protein N665_0125s0026 [Sinapis alba]|nr:hypothetical protein N665_0125s0026 [Sinapis alba]
MVRQTKTNSLERKLRVTQIWLQHAVAANDLCIHQRRRTPYRKMGGSKKTQAARYVLMDGEINKWRFSGPLMTCVEGNKARKIMEKVHTESFRNHSGGRSLAVKIKCHDYYWPTMIIFELSFQFHRFEVNQHLRDKVMLVLLESGLSSSREEAVEKMNECRSTTQPWC